MMKLKLIGLLMIGLLAAAQDVQRVEIFYTGPVGQYFHQYHVPAGTIFSVRKSDPEKLRQLAESGAVRIAVTSRPLKGAGLTSVKLAYQAPLLAVHPHCRLRNITSTQVRTLLEDNYGSWRTFGGSSARIRLYIKATPELPPPVMNTEHPHPTNRPVTILDLKPLGGEENSSEEKPLPTIQYSRPLRIQTENDRQSFIMLCTDPLGMAVFDITRFDEDRIHLLSVDQVPPTLENFRSGKYPLTTIWYLTVPEEPTAAERSLIRFIRGRKFAGMLFRDGMLPEMLEQNRPAEQNPASGK